MKDLLTLQLLVLQDLGHLLDVDTHRDRETVIARWSNEGDSFLTITLPEFETGFLQSLSRGRISPDSFPSFRTRAGLPVFLRGFLEKVFDRQGVVRSDADPEAIRAVRQVCCFSKKIERPVIQERLDYAEEAYIRTDDEVVLLDSLDVSRVDRLAAVMHILFRDILDKIETAIANFDLTPRHGPGAVVESLSQKDKWTFDHWYESLEDVFPRRIYTSHNFLCSDAPCVAPEDESPVKVIFVPKTMKGPRVIAIEPACKQYVQQAVGRFLYKELLASFPDQLNLFDQSINQRGAFLGSLDGSLATLDLSEASDRLSHGLVLLLAKRHPHLADALEACRSRQARTPSGRIIGLKKFASMGSALTFPLQSMVFFAIAVDGICQGNNLRLRHGLIRQVSVFGDDIIVPGESAHDVIANLQYFGLKINERKSFSSGSFRESCGKEYYAGHEVNILRAKRDIPTSGRDVESIASTVPLRNGLYRRGLWGAASFLTERLLACDKRLLPIPVDHPALGMETFLGVEPDRIHPSLQRDEIRRLRVIPLGKGAEPTGPQGLFKWFLNHSNSLLPTSKFEAVERPTALALHSRWYEVR